ncbi:MAG: hypothetical protein IJ863_08980 [Spirochaetales bacterium]|nr:hypothetical protein [Spirochaetales bacterium]
MKRFIIILAIAAIACTSAFAADIQLGVMQNLVNTSFLVDAEFDRFGVEGSVGMPVVTAAISGIEALIKGGSDSQDAISRDSSSEDPEESKSGGFSILGGAMANVYWKAYAGQKFSLRLGLQADMLGLFGTEGSRVFITYGPSIGFNYKFNERFSMNFTSAIPAALLLSPFGEDVSKYGAFIYSDVSVEGEQAIGEIFLALFGTIGGVGDQLARLSFKWSV